MALPLPTLDQIHRYHAEQLARFKIDYKDLPPSDQLPWTEGDIVSWITTNIKAIQIAQASQCRSPSPDSPSWDVVLYALCESAAMYLRKQDEIIKAIEAAQKGDIDQAIVHIKNAQEYVNDVAEALNCTFVQLCDFSNTSPDGSWFLSGAYCGAFVSKDTRKPLVGVCYKGTSNLRELNTDLDWDPVTPEENNLFGSLTHRGFYKGLFGKFSGLVAFDIIVTQLEVIRTTHKSAIHHFTGHSLGGAYCTLTYGEFLRRGLASRFPFGDLYSFAAPRVCEEPFASEVAIRTTPGSNKYVFRIVYGADPVPTVPPRTEDQFVKYPFVHVDGGWHLHANSGPQQMPSERPPNKPVPPQPIPVFIWDALDHRATKYYQGWQNAPHSAS